MNTKFVYCAAFALVLASNPMAAVASAETTLTKASTDSGADSTLSASEIVQLNFGLQPLLDRYHQLKSNGPVLERIEARSDLLEKLMRLSCEIRVVTNKIDREVADADQRRAILAERRDRAVRINTYANLISGGITGLVGGGLKLGDVNHIAPDAIDTVEGGIQTGLSAWALQQQHGERKIAQTAPGLLAAIMDPKLRNPQSYPADVWAFITAPQAGGKSARESLADKWTTLGFCLQHSGHRASPRERMKHMALLNPGSIRITIDLLEDRIAMLYDLRATVTRLDDKLLEILNSI